MPFESFPTTEPKPKQPVSSERLKRGMMEAGSVTFQDTRSAAAEKQIEPRPETTTANKDEIADKFFAKGGGDTETLNQRAALIALTEESGVTWNEIAAAQKIGTIDQDVTTLVQEYLSLWRSTSGQAREKMEKVRTGFKNMIQSKLH